jgi:dehydrogenase/reductase SDR family member 7B
MVTLSKIFVWLFLHNRLGLFVSSWSFTILRNDNLHVGIQQPSRRDRFDSFQSLKASTKSVDTADKMGPSSCDEATKEAFRGKTVLLTGASGGLGAQLALQLAECQVKTIILSGRKKESLQGVAKDCEAIHPSVETIVLPCDLASKDSVAELGSKALSQCGTIDVLINNGGVSSRSNFLDTKLEIDEQVMQINFFAGAALAKFVVPKMIEQRSGRIIWISSVQGLVGIPSRTSYAASKFAVQGYCESLRAELASSGVTVHVASPGYIRTNLSLSAVTGDGTNYGKMDDTTANGADPKDVAIIVLNSVAANKADFVVAAGLSARLAIWLRLLWPSLLQSKLVERFAKSQKEKNE